MTRPAPNDSDVCALYTEHSSDERMRLLGGAYRASIEAIQRCAQELRKLGEGRAADGVEADARSFDLKAAAHMRAVLRRERRVSTEPDLGSVGVAPTILPPRTRSYPPSNNERLAWALVWTVIAVCVIAGAAAVMGGW